jgi:hemerythrin-like metal-binding protein
MLVQEALGQDKVTGNSDDGLELGICFLSGDRKTLIFSGARFSIFEVRQGAVREVKGDRTGIGFRGLSRDLQFTRHRIEMDPDARFYMTSDGLLHQPGGDRRTAFGRRRFEDLLISLAGLPMAEQKEVIQMALMTYQGAEERRDDVSVIGFQVGAISAAAEPSTADTEFDREFELKFSIGFPEVDSDHKRLVTLVRQIDQTIATGDNEQIKQHLTTLVQYTEWHFRHEERLMLSFQYPKYEEHRKEHHDLAQQAVDIVRSLEGGHVQVLDGLQAFLMDWLVHHIQVSDREMGLYLARTI